MAAEQSSSPYFLTLVQSLATAALQQLGKIAHPFTGKVERSLPEAKVTIPETVQPLITARVTALPGFSVCPTPNGNWYE